VSLTLTPERLSQALEPIAPVHPDALTRLVAWTEVLDRWSRIQRLVGWRNAEGLLTEGICDAWAALPLVERIERPVVDLGSGSGLPGLILAAALPDRPFALVEVRRKRAAFLREAIRRMGLPRAYVHHCRAEALRDSGDAPRRPLLVARAFAPPPEVLAEATRWGAEACLLNVVLPEPDVQGWSVLDRAEGRPEGRRHLLLTPG
jgi:16S rRNA (guanine527-N7)-methyltransferase